MSDAVVTAARNTSLKIYAEVTEGLLSVLQFGRGCLDRQRHAEVLETLRATINDALERHAADSLTALMADAGPEESEPAEVRAFREQVLADARRANAEHQADPAAGSGDGFPETVVGSSDGGARAVIRLGLVTSLEFPAELLDESSTVPAEKTVRDAVNGALTQQAEQLGALSVPPADMLPDTSWEVLAEQVRRIEKGLL